VEQEPRPTRAVTLLALYEQRIIRLLALDAPLAQPALRLDPSVRDEVVAARELARLAARGPKRRNGLRVGPAPPAQRLLSWYQAAQHRFGVRWQLLAAVNFVESAFGKVPSAKEVAELLGVRESWVQANTRNESIPHIKLGRYRRYRLADVTEWLEAKQHGGPARNRRRSG
jgi:excisionase family DNA binding protein